WTTMPVVVAGQMGALVALRAYARWPRADWLFRVAAGVVGGTVLASAVVAATAGFDRVSRTAFLADAVLMAIAAVGWRCVWGLQMRASARRASRTRSDDLVDRCEEMSTVGSVLRSLYHYRELIRDLVLKDLKLKYRGSVFGFLWS